MSSSHGEITHVSDTALMVAACRALETENADGFMKDPFAARLAGERGMAMLKGLPQAEMMRFGIGVRSRLMDELVMQALTTREIATVVCVGCGLDTRPWRLDLKPELRWLEVDFEDMLDYKDGLMLGETPRCRRERLTADVTDGEQRETIYAAVGAAPALMITEGLLMYLPAATVRALAEETWQRSGIRHWMFDAMTTNFGKMINVDNGQSVRNVQASDFLKGEEILETAEQRGWVKASWRSYMTDAGFAQERGERMMRNAPRPPGPAPQGPPPEMLTDRTGVHWFTRG